MSFTVSNAPSWRVVRIASDGTFQYRDRFDNERRAVDTARAFQRSKNDDGSRWVACQLSFTDEMDITFGRTTPPWLVTD